MSRARNVETFAGYRALLGTSAAKLLEDGRAPPDYPEPVARTWDISLRAAEQQSQAARPLLELLAFLAPDALPREVLDGNPDALPEDLRDKLARNRAINALNRFSLIRAEGGSIAVHRLVQVVTRGGLDGMTEKACAEAAVRLVNAALPRPADEHTSWPAMGALLPHVLVAATAAERLGVDPEAAATVLRKAALYLDARAAWAEAEPLYRRAIDLIGKAFGPEHPDLAHPLNNLAELYRTTNRFAQAELLYQRALAICQRALVTAEEAFGPEHPNVALPLDRLGTVLNNLGLLYMNTRHLAEAEPLFKCAFKIHKDVYGTHHTKVAADCSNLGLLYGKMGRSTRAERLLKRAIAIGEKTLGPDSLGLATGQNNLGALYLDTGRYAEAEPLLVRAVALRENALGPEHPDLAQSLHDLAGGYRDTGRLAEAERLWERALPIIKARLPPDHPDLVVVLEEYADCLDALGSTQQATELRAQVKVVRP